MDDHASTLIVLLILIILSALFSASETALTAANRIRLKNQAEDGDKHAENALKLINKYNQSLSTLLVANNIVNTLIAALTTVLCTELFGIAAVGIATAIVTVLLVIFGEVIPKSFAASNAERIIKFAYKPLNVVNLILFPATKLLEIIKGFIIKNTEDDSPSVTEQELITIIDEIEDEGVLEEDEAELVQNAIEFNDIAAEEILTPRVDICAVSKDATKDEILEMFLQYNYSRMPVFDGTVDHIIGFINQKDFFAAIIKGVSSPAESLIKECIYVPSKKKIIDIMQLLQKEKVHMAVVTDEYGGTLGIITLEDILEQLVGDIWDEHDESSQSIFKVDNSFYEVLGDTSMVDIYEQILGMKYKEENLIISAYLLEKLEKIPEENETYSDEFLHYVIDKVDDHRIMKVRVYIE